MAAKDETPKPNPQEITCSLKLDTSAKGWHRTISKVLKTIEGVSYDIDMQSGIVTVTGMIDPKALMTRLRKSGKHAELITVVSGTLREAKIRKKKKQLQKEEEEEEYYKQLMRRYTDPYAYATGYYPQQHGGYYNHSGAGYPYYGATPDYYSSQYQPYPNYYQQPQPVGATAAPLPPVTHAPPRSGFPQPPPPMEIHPFYDPDTQCTIM